MPFVRSSQIAVCVLVPLLLTTAGGVVAAPDDPAAAEDRRPDPNKRVCRKVQVTGSHLPQRVCLKQRKWDQLREEAQRALQEANPSAPPEGS